MKRSKADIAAELTAHLSNEDGCANDCDTDALFKEWHNLPEEIETDLEEVEKWAFDTVRSIA